MQITIIFVVFGNGLLYLFCFSGSKASIVRIFDITLLLRHQYKEICFLWDSTLGQGILSFRYRLDCTIYADHSLKSSLFEVLSGKLSLDTAQGIPISHVSRIIYQHSEQWIPLNHKRTIHIFFLKQFVGR